MKTRNRQFSKWKTLSIVALLAASTGSVQAIPTFIDGTLSFSGSASTDTADFLTATKFTSFSSVTVGAANTLFGDYAGTAGASMTVTPFSWNPASTPVAPLWTFVSGGDTYSFDLDTISVDFASHTGLFLSGIGTAFITGPGVEKIPTQGLWVFTAQTAGQSTFTFSSSAFVPVPPTRVIDGGSTLVLLGSVLCGFSLIKRRAKGGSSAYPGLPLGA